MTQVRCAEWPAVVSSATEHDVRAWAWSNRLFALAGLAVLSAACLPAGDAPTGRQVWAGRDRSLTGVLPARSPADGVLRLLVSQPGTGPYKTDLYLFSVPEAGAVSEQLLVEDWSSGFCGTGLCVEVDSKGRVFVWSSADPVLGQLALVRVDPVTGERREFGRADGLQMSPSRQRVVVSRHEPVRAIEVIEADDTTTMPVGSSGSFVGEDYYYYEGSNTLRRLTAGGTPETIKAGVSSFSSLDTADGLRLVLFAVGVDPARPGPMSLMNPATLEEQLLPFDASRFNGFSSDGRWVLLFTGDRLATRDFALMELATGLEEPFQLPSYANEVAWRPGHAEVWMTSTDQQQGKSVTSIKRPGQPLVQIPVSAASFWVGVTASIFTSDGSYWFSTSPANQGNPRYFVGNADDPGAARFPLQPEGTSVNVARELSSGRLLVEAFYQTPYRNDIYLVAAATGETRVLGREGMVLASGARRVLANLHFSNDAGFLTAIDVDSGVSTVLAAEFVRAAFVEPPASGGSSIDTGARTAFQFRARFTSPYDGIWVTTLP